ncbi:glycosyl transferase [Litoreibacter roseus]|uniref:Glycosyl transferase n=1 Tax=Litoreibacter roseus TaxID=2601869 RepID=A0A6N6JHN8_9RHOB|nr:glycosyl transferase [Litoreibacter roseus]GFE65766.1 hypothetical protein KIN_28400 [Litoreibacter roseus]
MKQIICINWGTKYGATYINRLYGMVERNITPPFSFTCFTDNSDGIRDEVDCEDLPPINAVMPTNTRGIWPKSRLWGPKLGSLTGPVLFMDLDLVVTGNLDQFFEIGGPEDVVMTRNQSTPFERLGQTSLFRFPVGKLISLQQKFEADPQGVADEYRFEQRFVTRNAPGGVTFFPSDLVKHYTYNCCYVFPLNYFFTPRLPKNARAIIFAGAIDPKFAIEGRWSKRDKGHTPIGHLKALFTKDRFETPFRHLRHFVKPAPWVAKYWRE